MTTPAPQTTQPSHLTFFEAIKQKEKKKAPLIDALRLTRIERANVSDFIVAMNDLPGSLAAELIALTWGAMDVECRLSIMREWMDGKDKEQQAGAYHALSARLLTLDSDAAMTFLDHVVKLAVSSPVCLKRAVSTTRSEWVGTTPEQARFRRLDLPQLRTNGRLLLLDWLCECCPAELHPSDNDRRRIDLQKQSQARISVVAEWFEQLQNQEFPEPVALAVNKNLSKLRPKAAGSPVVQPVGAKITGVPPDKVPTPPALVPQGKTEQRVPPEEPNEMLRELFNPITRLFQKVSDRHHKELRSVNSELASAKSALERLQHDAVSYRSANVKSVERISELEEQLRVLLEAQARIERELSEAGEQVSALIADRDAERRQKQAIRDEGHEAVSRETQRERERLLAQLGQQIGNIVDGYREIRSRGALPEGTPAMLGDMMDELLSRLEAAGVRSRRE